MGWKNRVFFWQPPTSDHRSPHQRRCGCRRADRAEIAVRDRKTPKEIRRLSTATKTKQGRSAASLGRSRSTCRHRGPPASSRSASARFDRRGSSTRQSKRPRPGTNTTGRGDACRPRPVRLPPHRKPGPRGAPLQKQPRPRRPSTSGAAPSRVLANLAGSA